jgi:hypoxanthine phosphoribosyltransferase
MEQYIERKLIDEKTLDKRIKELADEISERFTTPKTAIKNKKETFPVFICVLKGAVIFLADLIRYLNIPCEIDFITISSYGDNVVSSGIITIQKDISVDIKNRDVIIIEDIVDSGLSLQFLIKHLAERDPKSVSTCTLLSKPQAHKCEVQIDYLGFDVENEFVVGYGLDYAGMFRNLPFIGILKKEVYE